MDTREMKEIEAAVEGILFASGEPVGIDRVCVALDLDKPTAELVLQRLQDYYSYERRGIRLLKWTTATSFAPRRNTETRYAEPSRSESLPS